MSVKDFGLSEILTENYLSLGVVGRDAISSMWDDFAQGRLTDDPEWLDELKTDETQIVAELLKLTQDIIKNELLHKMLNADGKWIIPE